MFSNLQKKIGAAVLAANTLFGAGSVNADNLKADDGTPDNASFSQMSDLERLEANIDALRYTDNMLERRGGQFNTNEPIEYTFQTTHTHNGKKISNVSTSRQGVGHREFNEIEQNLFHSTISEFERYIPVGFEYKAEGLSAPYQGIVAYAPSTVTGLSDGRSVSFTSNADTAARKDGSLQGIPDIMYSEVQITPNYDSKNEFNQINPFKPSLLLSKNLVIKHEGLHTIGEAHPHDGGKIAPDDDDPHKTIMAYNNSFMGLVDQSRLITAGIHDIAAMQRIYGQNEEHNSGNTVYTLEYSSNDIDAITTDNSTKIQVNYDQALWDGGGIDTLDTRGKSGEEHETNMDLNNGAITTVETGKWHSTDIHDTNISIAYQEVKTGKVGTGIGMIENGTIDYGSIIGNNADNTLHATSPEESSTYTGGRGADNFIVGDGGDITVTDYDIREGDAIVLSDGTSITSVEDGELHLTNKGNQSTVFIDNLDSASLQNIAEQASILSSNNVRYATDLPSIENNSNLPNTHGQSEKLSPSTTI